MQTFDSSGPNVKIRGNAYQVFERYIALAREASSAGDRIAAENLYQHAEHYFRVMNANGDGQGNPYQQPRPMTPADTEMNGRSEMDERRQQAAAAAAAAGCRSRAASRASRTCRPALSVRRLSRRALGAGLLADAVRAPHISE